MATIREYFDLDAKTLTTHATWQLKDAGSGSSIDVIAKVAMDFEANARYWYFYAPENCDPVGLVSCVIALPNVAQGQLGPTENEPQVWYGHSDYSERMLSQTLQFTRRIHLYTDRELSTDSRAVLSNLAHEKGFFLVVRDREYARKRSESEKPVAFISHDSRDKDPFVRELAHELLKQHCPVWYDEYSLSVGDSLRMSIEAGMREAQKCIIVLSSNFFKNEGWGRAEYDSIFTREILERKNVILPVWLGVTAKDVYDYSPRLADKVGLPASLGVPEVARRLANAVRAGA